VNMNVRGGRTKQLKKNYRNTRQIAAAAMSLIDFETDKTEFTELECAVRDGDIPQYAYFDSFHSQMEYVCLILKNYNLVESPTVILHRNRSELNNIAAYLTRHGITTEVVHKDFEDFGNNSVKICTLSSVKGMEFDNVIIVDLNDDIIPFPPGFTDPNDDYHISTERKLLYVAMTRARERLYMFSSGEPSRYLDEIDPETILNLNELPAEYSETEYNAENENEDGNEDIQF
ncbi:3'-5' exonuclease, partial [Nitrosomonas sp.]|uniref:3'-5' exonuclease n=1 Tax=Nitrosomonas sp. TaxID=42353 RepID=UPI001D4E732D